MKKLINDLMQFSDLPDDLKSPSLDDRFPNTGLLTVNFTIPNEYSLFSSIDGVPSQPLFVFPPVFFGVPSQPLSMGAAQEILIDDVGNILTDDVGNEYVQSNFLIPSDNVIDGVPSQPLVVLGTDEFDCLGIGGTDATTLTINGSLTIDSGNGRAFEPGLYQIGQKITASTITIEHNGTFMGRIAAGVCREMAISPTRETGFYTNVKTRESLSGQVIPPAGGFGGRIQGVDFRYKIDREIMEDFRRAYVTQMMLGFPFFIDFESDEWIPINKFYGQTDNKAIFQSSINGFKYSKRFTYKEKF